MSKKVTIKLNSKGIQALLKSDAIAGACQQQASAIAARAGDGYEVKQRNYPERTGFSIIAATDEANRDNLKNNTLLKAVGK